MNTPQHYEPEDLEFIKKNAETMTVPEIAFELGLGKTVIYNIGNRYGLTFKGAQPKAKPKKYMKHTSFVPDAEKPKIVHVKGEYSNHSPWGFAS